MTRIPKINVGLFGLGTVGGSVFQILKDHEHFIGDKPIAKEIMLKALSLGKHVVTANKAILAHHGLELYSEAFKHEVDIYFEAAVAGSIPILRTLREGFVSDKIISVQGIINGTSNY